MAGQASRMLLVAALVVSLVAAPIHCQTLRKPQPKKGCDCRKIYSGGPRVCGADLVTYGNECVASCANVLIRSNGDCPKCNIQTNSCNCGNAGYSPKCSFGLTWSNTCDANCGGYSCPMTNGVCQYNPQGSFIKTTGGSLGPGDVQKAAQKTSLPGVDSAPYSYTKALHYAQIFFESMRSGSLPRQRLAWRGDSCLKCRGPSGEDLSKGYYEAGGSFLKLGLVEAFTVTMLADTALTFPNGYKKAGDMGNVLDNIGWGADYLMAAHSKPDRFVAVLGNSTLDFNYYGAVEDYDTYVKSRPSCYIDTNTRGSEIAGEAAAALAATVIAFKANNVKRDTNQILTHAQQLYDLANNYQGSYQTVNPKSCLGTHKRLYPSSNGYYDELAWAAAWLYRATKQPRYLTDARNYYGKLKQPAYSFETGDKTAGLTVLMQTVDPANAGRYLSDAKGYFRYYIDQIIPHTPRGFAYPYHWGAMRPTTQMAFLALKQSKQLRSSKTELSYAAQLFNYAGYQMNYVLGAGGRAWLGGWPNGPTYLWHKYSYNSYIDSPLKGIIVYSDTTAQKTDNTFESFKFSEAAKFDFEGSRTPQRFVPYGALYGAPLQDDSIVVGRKDFTYTEPTTDGACGMSGAFAGLAEYYNKNQGAQNDCGLDLGWNSKGAKLTNKSVNNTRECSQKASG